MAVGADGELTGSIGGGVMEVNLVEESRRSLADSALRVPHSLLSEQVHQKNSPNASGMICSGKQTVIFKLVTPGDAIVVGEIADSVLHGRAVRIEITKNQFVATTDNPSSTAGRTDFVVTDNDFRYTETLGFPNHLYIVGGGHCALALSELMSKMDFHISLFDDRPELNTIEKNLFAHVMKIVDTYERIGDHIPSGESAYVVVMTLGYKTDEVVVRGLIDKEFKYFGVLGSKAKMAAMLGKLKAEGIPEAKIDRIRTPIGLPINSRSPEEIAVSIAAEIIAVKNG
jgi:xanthine dehydrogenase accessory factor